jgi:acyl-CoA thioesterase FadM
VAEWLETYRGVVNPWECDVVQHFTIAYYFDRLADATRNFFDFTGVEGDVVANVRHGPVRGHAVFQQELRAGSGLHILTAVMGIDACALRLAHQIVNSTTGKTVTWLSERYTLPETLPAQWREKLASLALPWHGPSVPDPPTPNATQGLATARDRVKPWEIGEDGTMSPSAHIHRFSAAGMQILAAVGMTAAYMHDERRGFSTFALDLTRVGHASVGERVDIATAVSHLGNSSLRLAHRMTGPNNRQIAFLVQSGVHLDMDTRRSTAIPNQLRASIQGHLAGDGPSAAAR